MEKAPAELSVARDSLLDTARGPRTFGLLEVITSTRKLSAANAAPSTRELQDGNGQHLATEELQPFKPTVISTTSSGSVPYNQLEV